jgi:hypothetical protein
VLINELIHLEVPELYINRLLFAVDVIVTSLCLLIDGKDGKDDENAGLFSGA